VQPLARIRRNRQRPPSNGSIERAQSTSPGLHALRRRASDRVLASLVLDLISCKENSHVPVAPFLKRSWVPSK
jgi:hypothetical protein